jgi:hypothetical protein
MTQPSMGATPPTRARGLPKAILQRDRCCNAPPEACAGRRPGLTQRRDGSDSPVQAAGRSGGVLPFRPPGAKRRKRLLFGPRSQKGPVDCVHQCRRLLLSSQERPSLQAPLRRHHLTLRRRRLTRSRRNRSRYPGQRSRQWSTTRLAVTCRNLGAVTARLLRNRPFWALVLNRPV